MSLHFNSTLALWVEGERGDSESSKKRLRMAKITNWKPGKMRVAGRTTYYCPHCQKRNIIIGLTGGIACGKSTIIKLLNKSNMWNNFNFILTSGNLLFF